MDDKSFVDVCCQMCVFWKPIDKDDPDETSGRCRRHAPKPIMTKPEDKIYELSDWVVWPMTSDDDCCGEYKMSTRRKIDGSYHRGNEYGVTAAQEHVLAAELQALYFTGIAEMMEKFKIRERRNEKMFRANEADLRYELCSRDGNILASVEVVFHHLNMNAKVKTEYYEAGREYIRKNRFAED